MKKYTVDFEFHIKGSIEVDAKSREHALDIGDAMTETLDPNDVKTISDECECVQAWEVK